MSVIISKFLCAQRWPSQRPRPRPLSSIKRRKTLKRKIIKAGGGVWSGDEKKAAGN